MTGGIARRRRRGEQTRALISQAVRDILADEGWTGMSSNAIARRVGVSTAALYRHYPTLQDLIHTAVVETYEDLNHYLYEEDPSVRDLPAALRMAAIGLRYLQWMNNNPSAYGLIMATGVHPGFSDFLMDEKPGPLANLLADISEGQKEGVFDDSVPPEVLMGRLIGAIEGAHRFRRLGGYTGEDLLNWLPFLTRGILKPAP